jgi:hypothetical protein
MSKKNNYRKKALFTDPSVYGDAEFYIRPIASPHSSADLNKLGYRSIEFEDPAEILTSGCSFTFGQGVQIQGNWPSQLSEISGMKHHNLGAPGTGVGLQVGNIFSYIHQYGKPKIILCLFPEFTRMRMISNRNFVIPPNHEQNKEILESDNDIIDYSYTYNRPNNISRISKIPHKADDVVPEELAINISINYIKMLEMYCNSNGIILLWSTWNSKQLNYINNNINMMSFKNFIKVDVDKWHSDKIDNYRDTFHLEREDENRCRSHDEECTSYTDCHSDLREIYGKNFDYSEDIDQAPSHHWGAHRQRHIAETFLRGINEYNTRN